MERITRQRTSGWLRASRSVPTGGRSFALGVGLGLLTSTPLITPAGAASPPAFPASQGVFGEGDEFDQHDTRLFTLSEDREAERTAISARGHLAALRFERAIEDLQRLIEFHSTDVLPSGFVPIDPGSSPSVYPAHRGAARWAIEQLNALSSEGREVYESRFGDEADAALVKALATLEPRALLEVTERWPISAASRRAWWALGDLELVRGHLASARSAFERAAELHADSKIESSEAFATRLAALDELEQATWRRPDRSFTLQMPAPGETGPNEPSTLRTPLLVGLEPWTVPIPPSPFSSASSSRESFNLIPVIDGDNVYVSNSLELLSVDGATGAIRWQTPRPNGWAGLQRGEVDDLVEAVDLDSGLIAPAVGSGVVVAALQIPVKTQDAQSFQGMTIMLPIPQRRLFAFDQETGEPLWDHAPPSDWDGYNLDTFPREMAVTGSPVIVEGRVLVPCSRMEGRVKLHVACYDLTTGKLQWQSQVLTGQRELNMFNRHEREYSAPPVTVHGDTVVLVTHLGTVAALDLGSGRIRWQALYDQIPLPGTTGFLTAQRPREWRNSPAVVASGTVLATPLDSEDLLGIDLVTGRVRWAYPQDHLRPSTTLRCKIDTLLGATGDSLFFGGPWLASWTRPGGMDSARHLEQGRLEADLTEGARRSFSAGEGPRPLLQDDLVFIAGRAGLQVFDAITGERLPEREFTWTRGYQGNPAIGEGMFVTLNSRSLVGWLDMRVLEERARERFEMDPTSVLAALELVDRLSQRASDEMSRGNAFGSLELYEEVEALLSSEIFEGDARTVRARVKNLREFARNHELLGDLNQGRSLLVAALELTQVLADRRGVLFDLERLSRTGDRAAWREILETIEVELAGQSLFESDLNQDPRWIEFLRGTALEGSGSLEVHPVPSALWVRVSSALEHTSADEWESALLDWHEALGSFGDTVLGPSSRARDLIEPRMADLLVRGGPSLYSTLSTRAEARLAEALESGDVAALRRLPLDFPFAPAAQSAFSELLDQAFATGDLDGVASSLRGLRRGGLEGETEGRRSLEEVDGLTALALTAGNNGNTQLELALIQNLASSHPDAIVRRAPYQDWKLGALAPALAEQHPTAHPQISSFGSGVALDQLLEGHWEEAADLMVDGVHRRFIERRGELLGFDSDEPTQVAFHATLDLSSKVEGLRHWFSFPCEPGGRLVAIEHSVVSGFDARDGKRLWTWPSEADEDAHLTLSGSQTDGILVLRGRELDRTARAIGLDPATGVVLWRTELPDDGPWLTPVSGEGLSVFLDNDYGQPTRALVLDAFTGRLGTEFELTEHLGVQGPRRTFFADGSLFTAGFLDEALVAFDPQNGRERFRVEAGEGRDLSSVIVHRPPGEPAHIALLITPSALGSSRGGELVSVDSRYGSTQTLAQIQTGDELIGIRYESVSHLDDPWLFLVSNLPGSRRTPISAIDMGRGRAWSNELPLSHEELWTHRWARPAVSSTTAAVVYAAKESGSGRRRLLRLDFYDLATGFRNDTRLLAGDFDDFGRLTLEGFGESLWVGSLTGTGRSDRIEIWR